MSESQDKHSRTEQATDKRLNDARAEGNVPTSREVANFSYLLASLLVFAVLGYKFISSLGESMAVLFASAGSIHLESGGDVALLMGIVGHNAAIVAGPIIMTFAVAGVLASVAQTPPAPIFKRVTPQLSRLSPANGLKRIFSLSGLMEFLKLSLRMIVVVTMSAVIIAFLWHDFTNSVWNDPAAILQLARKSILALLASLALLSFAIVVFDLPASHLLWRRSLKMSKQEIKDEHKQQEGDPHMKARRRSIARTRARRRMLTGVPRATVVIANPTHFSVALRYVRSEGGAPRVVAKGQDLVALSIRRIAEEHNIPIVEDKALARSLYAKVEVDQMIPVEFYKAIAEVLIRLQNRRAKTVPGRA